MTQVMADEKSRKAREASRLANLWLEHPWVAHDLHELAASAQEQVSNLELAAEHRRAAQYWASKGCAADGLRYRGAN